MSLPKPENRNKIHQAMFDKHSHADLHEDHEIVYTEEDVKHLMCMMRDAALDWAVENVTITYNNKDLCSLDKESILVGKTHPELQV